MVIKKFQLVRKIRTNKTEKHAARKRHQIETVANELHIGTALTLNWQLWNTNVLLIDTTFPTKNIETGPNMVKKQGNKGTVSGECPDFARKKMFFAYFPACLPISWPNCALFQWSSSELLFLLFLCLEYLGLADITAKYALIIFISVAQTRCRCERHMLDTRRKNVGERTSIGDWCVRKKNLLTALACSARCYINLYRSR